MPPRPQLQPPTPAAFRDALFIVTGSGARRFGECMAEFQKERFALLDPALVALSRGEQPDKQRFWVEATKGASKDSDLAICLLWLLAFTRRSLRIQVGAFDADQADEIRQIVRQILRVDAPMNRAVASLVEVQASKFLNKTTGSVAEILTTDSKGSHGSRPDLVLVNELSHIGDQEFAETLLDNADKMPRGLVIIATNAGFQPSWQADWRAAALASPRWAVHIYDRPAPWVSAAALEESRKRNSANRYNRLWAGQWVSSSGDALNAGDIDRAVCLPGPTTEPERGWVYVAGLDIGLSKDASAFVVVGKHVGWQECIEPPPRKLTHRETVLSEAGLLEIEEPDPEYVLHEGTGRIRLVQLDLWKPTPGNRVDLAEVEAAIVAANRRWGLAITGADPWQCEYLIARTNQSGVVTVGVDFVAANLRSMCAAVLEAFVEWTLEIFSDAQLLSDLRSLRVEERSYGMRLTSPRGPNGHGDSATALAIALHLAKNVERRTPQTIKGELLVWP